MSDKEQFNKVAREWVTNFALKPKPVEVKAEEPVVAVEPQPVAIGEAPQPVANEAPQPPIVPAQQGLELAVQ
jgi:hypothetical protein